MSSLDELVGTKRSRVITATKTYLSCTNCGVVDDNLKRRGKRCGEDLTDDIETMMQHCGVDVVFAERTFTCKGKMVLPEDDADDGVI